ncbi:MAG: iron chaperone [Actinomycetota bacterium]
MTEKKPARKSTKGSATGSTGNTTAGFTAEERAAMKARAQEQKAEARASKNRADGENALLEAIAAMKGSDRDMAKRLHAIITESAPDLWPKTWYGMPAYAKDGKVVCYFQSAEKFKARYATFGFNDEANLDKGSMWPVSYALKELTTTMRRQSQTS